MVDNNITVQLLLKHTNYSKPYVVNVLTTYGQNRVYCLLHPDNEKRFGYLDSNIEFQCGKCLLIVRHDSQFTLFPDQGGFINAYGIVYNKFIYQIDAGSCVVFYLYYKPGTAECFAVFEDNNLPRDKFRSICHMSYSLARVLEEKKANKESIDIKLAKEEKDINPIWAMWMHIRNKRFTKICAYLLAGFIMLNLTGAFIHYVACSWFYIKNPEYYTFTSNNRNKIDVTGLDGLFGGGRW